MGIERGTLVTPNVKLIELLGQGGMGSVWIADHVTLNTQVAVKFISAQLANDEGSIRRFRREASTAASIKSPHVVQMFDYGIMDDGVPYMVMELLDGESLAQRIARKGALSFRQSAILISQIAKVLTIAHNLDIIHRDIKPQNLFLLDSGYELFTKVLDFGIAKYGQMHDAATTTTVGGVRGTLRYMSPERLLGEAKNSPEADLWALAVVAYEALTGRVPFKGKTATTIYLAAKDGQFLRPSQCIQQAPGRLDDWFDKALAYPLASRFSTAKKMAAAFRNAVFGSEDDIAVRSRSPQSLAEWAAPHDLQASTLPTEAAVTPTAAESTVVDRKQHRSGSSSDDVVKVKPKPTAKQWPPTTRTRRSPLLPNEETARTQESPGQSVDESPKD